MGLRVREEPTVKHIAPNGLTVEMVGADETEFGDEYAVYIGDGEGEIVMWTADEWIEEPKVVASVVNAIMMGTVQGPAALRASIGRTT